MYYKLIKFFDEEKPKFVFFTIKNLFFLRTPTSTILKCQTNFNVIFVMKYFHYTRIKMEI